MCDWNRNLEVLKSRYPGIGWENYLNPEEEQGTVWSEPARDGNPVLYVRKNDKDYRINSAFRPLEEAKRWAEQFEIKGYEARVILFGMGNGYLIRELLKRCREDTILVMREPDIRIFAHVIKNYDLGDILENEQVRLVVDGINEKSWDDLLNKYFAWDNIRYCIPCAHLQYDSIYQEQCLAFFKSIQSAQRLVLSNTATLDLLSKEGCVNTLYNIREFRDNSLLYDLRRVLPKDVSAIIVAAGPSLDYNIEQLRAAKGHAILIAVDKAAGSMLDKGIRPDFLITLDPKKLSRYLADERCADIPLIAEYGANRKITENHPGRKIFFGTGDYMTFLVTACQKNLLRLSSGGSVATAAFSVCLMLGIKTIILVGQDLAYRDGVTHAGGRIMGEGKKGKRHFKVEDIYGGQIDTRNDWIIYLYWYEKAIAANPQVKVIDATEGGAKIHGTEIMPLKDAIEQYCSGDIFCEDVVDRMPPAFTPEQYAQLRTFMEKDCEDLEQIKETADKNVELAERLIKACRNQTIDKPEYSKLIRRISENKDEILKKRVNLLLEEYIAGESQMILTDINSIGEDQAEDQERIYTRTKEMYKLISGETENLKGEFRKTIEVMRWGSEEG